MRTPLYDMRDVLREAYEDENPLEPVAKETERYKKKLNKEG